MAISGFVFPCFAGPIPIFFLYKEFGIIYAQINEMHNVNTMPTKSPKLSGRWMPSNTFSKIRLNTASADTSKLTTTARSGTAIISPIRTAIIAFFFSLLVSLPLSFTKRAKS